MVRIKWPAAPVRRPNVSSFTILWHSLTLFWLKECAGWMSFVCFRFCSILQRLMILFCMKLYGLMLFEHKNSSIIALRLYQQMNAHIQLEVESFSSYNQTRQHCSIKHHLCLCLYPQTQLFISFNPNKQSQSTQYYRNKRIKTQIQNPI